MRIFFFLLLALGFFLCDREVVAQKGKKGGPIMGKVFEIDQDKGTIRLLVETRTKKEKSTSDPQFAIDEETKFIFETSKKEIVGKEGLKDVKVEDIATVTIDKDFKVVSIQIRSGKKK